jgi:hypothetical protein
MSEEAVADIEETSGAEVESPSSAESSPVEASSPTPAATAAAPAAAAAPQKSVWDAFRSLPDFKGADDIAIARRLYASMEREKAASHALAQYQQYVPIAQQYLQNREPFEQFQQHRESFQRWLATQQQPAAAEKTTAAEAVKKWWSPPEVRESYKQYLIKDENGREVISPEAPLDAKHALYEYQKYKADFAQKFLTNPEDALGPMVQEIAQRQAQEIVQAQMEQAQQQQYVSGLETENRDWLYDERGQPTEEGIAAQRYIEEAATLGIGSAQARWDYATKMIERDLLEKLRTQQGDQERRSAFEAGLPPVSADAPPQVPAPDVPTQAQKDIEFLRREASRNPSRAAGSSDPRTPQAPLTFEQRLAKQLARDGLI